MKRTQRDTLVDLSLGIDSHQARTYADVDVDTKIDAEHIIVRTGDLWTLGDHRLICGSSTDPATVSALLQGDRPNLMVTDPPYGVAYDPSWRNEALRADGTSTDTRAVGVVNNDTQDDWREAWALFPGDVAYVWHAGHHSRVVQESLEACNFQMRAQIIWVKPRFVIGRGNYHFQHEPAFYVVRKGGTANWQGARDQTSTWFIEHRKSETGHGTQKPVECMRRPIVNNTQQGDLVYEPFSGSGTTIIAAELTGRHCRAVELSPLYCYVAIMRWQTLTGRLATLNGEPFSEVMRRRANEPMPSPPLPAPSIPELPKPTKPEVSKRSAPPEPTLLEPKLKPPQHAPVTFSPRRAQFATTPIETFASQNKAVLDDAGDSPLTFDEDL